VRSMRFRAISLPNSRGLSNFARPTCGLTQHSQTKIQQAYKKRNKFFCAEPGCSASFTEKSNLPQHYYEEGLQGYMKRDKFFCRPDGAIFRETMSQASMIASASIHPKLSTSTTYDLVDAYASL
jgi:hypothetical protein